MTSINIYKRVSSLEVRLDKLERDSQAKPQLARLTDNPPTVEHAFAIRESLKAAARLAELNIRDGTQEMRELSGEILNWRDAMALSS